MKKLLALVLAVLMVVGVLAACNDTTDPTNPTSGNNNPTDPTTPAAPDSYTYNAAISEFPSGWNVHTYQTATDSVILDYISDAFYKFDYNENKDGFVIVPGLVKDDHPVDVTADYVGKYGIEEGDKAQVYILNLREDLKWEDGTPIKAVDFIESAKRLLNPIAKNYRADSLYSGNMVIHNAHLYAFSEQKVAASENALIPAPYAMADFTKNDDGVYVTPQGELVYIAVTAGLEEWLGGNSLADYVGAYGAAMFDVAAFETLAAAADEETGLAPMTDETLNALTAVITFSAAWGETAEDAANYLIFDYTYPKTEWEDVGIFAIEGNEYAFGIAIDLPLEGFYLKYSLTSCWLVKTDLYDKCESVDADGIYSNTYGTSVETTMSYGPYKLTSFQLDKQFVVEKNEHFYDLTDDTYQTTKVVYDCVPEAATRLELFLQGKLDSYGLQKDDMDTYSMSDSCYYETGDSTFAMVFNPDKTALEAEQAKAGENINKTILTLVEFRQAMSFAMNRAEFCLATSPTNSAAFGMFSTVIISDPEAGTAYRTTDVSKNTLAEFWGLADEIGEGKLYPTVDDAVESITGYNLEQARKLFDAAYDKAIAEGLMDENDVVEIKVGTPNNTSAFYNGGYEYIVNNYTKAVEGTKLEGKLRFTRDDTLGNNFSDALKNNTVDMLFGVGWTGSALDPYGLMEAYIDPSYQYDDSTDFTSVTMDVVIEGVKYTASVSTWYDIMTGKTATIKAEDGTEKEYSCGPADNDPATRLQILGNMENTILMMYNFIPLMDDAAALLKSHQINYATEDYVFGMGFGGIKYYTYEYTDAEWDAYVAENNGELSYK